MFDVVEDLVTRLRETAAGIDHRELTGGQAAELVRLFTVAERICAAIRTLAARRAEETKVWQREGHRTAAEWLAVKTGTSVGQAIGSLETARRLEALPVTQEAFSSGHLSELQAREISAAGPDRRSERALIETAQTQPVSMLREECRRVRAAAISDELAAYEGIRRRRYFRHWCDVEGAIRLEARLTPDAGAAVIAAIDARRDRIIVEARRAGRRESAEAHAADALVELATESDPKRPRAMIHVLVDHRALVSGRATGGQRCEIPGVGRIPAATARALTSDGIIKAIVTKGSDVQRVVHIGRTVPARVRTALEVRDPTCVVPACHVRKGLEIDHYRVAYAAGGRTTLDNLARLCRWHHYQKTYLGYRLTGEPGAWRWITPSEQEGARPPPAS
jgi:uncharacterized protein DUF222